MLRSIKGTMNLNTPGVTEPQLSFNYHHERWVAMERIECVKKVNKKSRHAIIGWRKGVEQAKVIDKAGNQELQEKRNHSM